MLTATYSIVAISTEQSKTRGILYRLQQHIQHAWKGLQNIDLRCVESAFDSLMQFDRYCCSRKVEACLIPAIRRVTDGADSLLGELEALSASGRDILRSIREQLRRAFEDGAVRIHEVCSSMELYCSKLQRRLAKEEDELFPLARRLISVDQWFSIAADFLYHDAETRERSRYSPPPPLLPASAAVCRMAAH